MFTKQEIKVGILSHKKNNNEINWKKIWSSSSTEPLRTSIRAQYSEYKDMSDSEKAYRIVNDIDHIVYCPVCLIGKCKFFNFKLGFRPVCSIKCSNQKESTKEKRKKTNLDKYGCENVFQNEKIKEKSQLTMLRQYGVTNISQTELFSDKMKNFYSQQPAEFWSTRNEKSKKTSTERYGVDHPSASQPIKDKVKAKFQQNYGVDHYFKTDEFQTHLKNICNEKYGADNYFSSKIGKDSIKKILQERYQVDNPSFIPGIIDKRCKTMMNRYNREWFSQQHISDEILNLTKNYESCKELLDKYGVVEICHRYNVNMQWLSRRLAEHNLWNPSKSWLESGLRTWLTNHNINFKQNDRKLIKPLEVDFLINDQLAVELNGLYVHSELHNPDRFYHKKKLDMIKSTGKKVIMIFEHEYFYKTNIVYSMIKSRLGFNQKIMARKCQFYKPTAQEKNQFLEDNHIQGQDKSAYSIALCYNKEIVAILTLSKPRFTKHAECEIIRFCSKAGVTVVGGLSKMFTQAQKDLNFTSCITYADLRFGSGESYSKLGFVFQQITPPNYWYFNTGRIENHCVKVESRIKYQKHKLSKLFKNFDINLTEWENMKNNKFNRFWDCGSARYFWNKK